MAGQLTTLLMACKRGLIRLEQAIQRLGPSQCECFFLLQMIMFRNSRMRRPTGRDMQDKYEIHYVKNGLKKVVITHRNSMNWLEAWKAALLIDGACVGATVGLRCINEAIVRAEESGISKVRWSKASHTASWSERARMTEGKLMVTQLD